MLKTLIMSFFAGIAAAALFLGVAMASDGRGAPAAKRPGCRVIIGAARTETDHFRCSPVA